MLNILSLSFQVADVPCKLIAVNPHNEYSIGAPRHLQHSHSALEMHCIWSGNMTMDCIGESIHLTGGHMLILPQGMYHYVRNTSPDADRMDILLEVGGERNSREAQTQNFFKSLHLRHPLLLHADAHPELFALLEKIRRITLEYKDDFLQRERLKMQCVELVLLLGIAAESCAAEPEQKVCDYPDMRKNHYVIDDFFNHNYHGSSGMEVLAKRLSMSVRQTGRELQRTYGKGFREKMNECRLAVAVDLLQNTAKSISEISEILGYGDPANFSSFVKRQTGKAPSQIRKSKNIHSSAPTSEQI